MIRIVLGAFLLLANNSCAIPTDNPIKTVEMTQQEQNSSFQVLFNNYFQLKDALVKTDYLLATEKAKTFLSSIGNVKIAELSEQEKKIWQGLVPQLEKDVKMFSDSKSIDSQRKIFVQISNKMYQLRKSIQIESTTYYQYCSMANNGKGAYWLSQESKIKNPYYGSEMLSCGTVKETIK